MLIVLGLSVAGLIRDISNKNFDFTDRVNAQGLNPMPDVVVPGPLPGSLCGSDEIDLLRYMMPENSPGPTYGLNYCKADGSSGSESVMVERFSDAGNGRPGFYVRKGNNYEQYEYNGQNVYFVGDTSWEEVCPGTGEKADYQVFDGDNPDHLGGRLDRCVSDGEQIANREKIKRYGQTDGLPLDTSRLCYSDDPVSSFVREVRRVEPGSDPFAPQIEGMDVIVIETISGAGAGELKYYCAGYGLCGFSDGRMQSSIAYGGYNPTLSCSNIGNPGDPDEVIPRFLKEDAIKDNYARCEYINPRTGKPLTSKSSLVGKAGINQGSMGGNVGAEINFIQGGNSLGVDMGMGYVLSLFNSAGDAGSAAGFIKTTVDAGLTPIVRLCFGEPGGNGACGFSLLDDSIIMFYQGIEAQLPEGYEYIGLVGPNEPSTAQEMVGFEVALNDYATLYTNIERVALELQDYRAINGGNLLMAPAAFNLINTLDDSAEGLAKDDFYQFKNLGVDAGLFDYLVGNIYEKQDWNAWEILNNQGVMSYLENNGLKLVISEYGAFDPTDATKAQMRTNFALLCESPLVDGISFFRSFEELPAGIPRPEQLSTAFLAELSRSCSKQRPWPNCNFDSCVFPDNELKVEYGDSTAEALSCNNNVDTSNINATLRADCSSGTCVARAVKTIQVRMPIKSFGSTSMIETSSKPYTSISAEVASFFTDIRYDPMNQFAGPLIPTGTSLTTTPTTNNSNTSTKGPSIIILGDSLSAPEPRRGTYLPDSQYEKVFRECAIPGSSAEGFLNEGLRTTLNQCLNFDAEYVVIMLGTNDCGGFSSTDLSNDLKEIINLFTDAGKKILLSTIPYRNDSYNPQCIEPVENYNTKIKALAVGNVQLRDVTSYYRKDNRESYLGGSEADGIHITNYDPINQDTLRILTGQTQTPITPSIPSGTYPMPMLGSAINNSTELTLYSQEYYGTPGLEAYPNPGSLSWLTDRDVEADINRGLITSLNYEPRSRTLSANDAINVDPSLITGHNYIPDERTLYLSDSGQYIDKADLSIIDGLRDYDPSVMPNRFRLVDASCSVTNVKYLQNEDDYITGPEIPVGEVSYSYTSSAEMCRQFARRDIESSTTYSFGNRNMNCVYNTLRTLPTTPVRRCNLFNCTTDQIKAGQCNIPETYADCFDYTPSSRDRVNVKEKPYPDLPTFDIPGIYDALYRQYTRLQDELENRNLQIIFRENIGWKAEVIGMVRDGIRTVADPRLSLYEGEEYEKSVNMLGDQYMCEQPAIYDNAEVFANGTNTIKKDVYYEWLGYLDIIQELRMVYSQSTALSSEYSISNPFKDNASVSSELRNKSTILIPGASMQFTSAGAAMPTCDQIMICTQFTKAQLISDFGFDEDTAQTLCPDDTNGQPAIDWSQTYSCVSLKDEKPFENKLETELCERGYTVDGVCNVLKCIPGNPVTNENVIIDNPEYTGTACPTPECALELATGQGGIRYPGCNNKIQTTGTGANNPGNCAYWRNQIPYFGDPLSSNYASEYIVSLTSLSAARDGDGFLGMSGDIKINKNAAEIFLRAEAQFNSLYGENRQGSKYFLPSYPSGYTFVFARSYVPGETLGTDSATGGPSYSNHAFGIAMDINATTNWGNHRPTTAACIIDIPPELVQVFEANGIRWGGRFAKNNWTEGTKGYFDPMHFEVLPECAPELIDIPETVTTPPPIDDTIACIVGETPPENDGSILCNEFNCNLGQIRTFTEALGCVSGDTALTNGKYVFSRGNYFTSTDSWVDRYGFFCDNETRGLPFAHNFAEFYDSYLAPGSPGGRTCGQLPPATPRAQDEGLRCTDFGGNPDLSQLGVNRYPAEFQDDYLYYREALINCPIPNDQTGWTVQNTFGLNPEQLTDMVMNEVSYAGMQLANTPRNKVLMVIEQAKKQNINPFILLGLWATESWFGQYKPQCTPLL
jgi:hypothetical protein